MVGKRRIRHRTTLYLNDDISLTYLSFALFAFDKFWFSIRFVTCIMNGSVTIVTNGSRCVTIWPRDICAALFNATNSTIFTAPLIFLTSHCLFWTHSKTRWMVWNSTFKTWYERFRFSEKCYKRSEGKISTWLISANSYLLTLEWR